MQAVRVTEVQDAQALRLQVQLLIQVLPIQVHDGVASVRFCHVKVKIQWSGAQPQLTQIVRQHMHTQCRWRVLPTLYSFPLLKAREDRMLRPRMKIYYAH